MTEESIKPAFDWINGVWYTKDGITARSLAALQQKLPGVKIEGYYPDGYSNVVKPRTTAAVAKVTLAEAHGVDKTRPPRFVARPEVDSKVRTEEQQKSRQRYVQQKRHREAFIFPKISWTEERKEQLRKLVDDGLTSAEIALQFNCSGNAVIGACNRYGYQLKYFDK